MHWVFKGQKIYMINPIVKPFEVSVETSFRRVETIANMMKYFPPSYNNGKEPSQAQWNKFMHVKKMPKEDKREISMISLHNLLVTDSMIPTKS